MIKPICVICALAIAGTYALPVYASEWVGSESESIGTFGDIDTSIDDNLQELFDRMEEVINEDDFSDPQEDIEDDFNRDSEVNDSLDINDFVQDEQINDDAAALINNAADDDFSDFVQPYANYNAYYGVISSTYLEYMRGFLPKLGFKQHYVCARTSQYDYIFAYGDDLIWNGSFFTGFNLTVVQWNTYNTGSFTSGVQSTFNLYPGSFLVYSDLSDVYPSLADSSGVSLRQILIILTIMGLCWTIDHMYNVRKIRRLK